MPAQMVPCGGATEAIQEASVSLRLEALQGILEPNQRGIELIAVAYRQVEGHHYYIKFSDNFDSIHHAWDQAGVWALSKAHPFTLDDAKAMQYYVSHECFFTFYHCPWCWKEHIEFQFPTSKNFSARCMECGRTDKGYPLYVG